VGIEHVGGRLVDIIAVHAGQVQNSCIFNFK